jgi:hypothetical protein
MIPVIVIPVIVIPVIVIPAFITFVLILAITLALVTVLAMMRVIDNDKVPGIGALADNGLPAVAFVPAVPTFIGIVVPVRHGLIDDHFVPAVQVITPQEGRPGSGLDPMAVRPVDVLPFGYIIIGFDVGQVIIFYVIVTRRTPQRLVDDVNIDLGPEGKTYQAGQDKACP